MTCLNPTKPVGKQIVEAIQHHRHLSKAEAKAEAIKYLSLVNIPNPEERAKRIRTNSPAACVSVP